MNNFTSYRLARSVWTTAVLLSLAVTGAAYAAQTPEQFTIDRTLTFASGTNKMRAQLNKTPAAREITAGNFVIAMEDLNDDGRPEFILLARSAAQCRDGGCALLILHKTDHGIEPLLTQKVTGKLALTNERVDGYRALAVLNGSGQIAVGNRSGSPLFGKQVVYPMQPREQAQAAVSAVEETKPAKESGGSSTAPDKKAEKAIAKFLSSQKTKHEGAESSGSALADLDGDGKPEIILVWTLLGPTYWRNTLTILSQSAKGYKPVSSLLLNGLAELAFVKNGTIAVNQTTYAKSDPTCCPSIKKQIKYTLSGKKLSEMKE